MSTLTSAKSSAGSDVTAGQLHGDAPRAGRHLERGDRLALRRQIDVAAVAQHVVDEQAQPDAGRLVAVVGETGDGALGARAAWLSRDAQAGHGSVRARRGRASRSGWRRRAPTGRPDRRTRRPSSTTISAARSAARRARSDATNSASRIAVAAAAGPHRRRARPAPRSNRRRVATGRGLGPGPDDGRDVGGGECGQEQARPANRLVEASRPLVGREHAAGRVQHDDDVPPGRRRQARHRQRERGGGNRQDLEQQDACQVAADASAGRLQDRARAPARGRRWVPVAGSPPRAAGAGGRRAGSGREARARLAAGRSSAWSAAPRHHQRPVTRAGTRLQRSRRVTARS